jgi:uncharacterized membrane protein YidH (DUF202 family)
MTPDEKKKRARKVVLLIIFVIITIVISLVNFVRFNIEVQDKNYYSFMTIFFAVLLLQTSISLIGLIIIEFFGWIKKIPFLVPIAVFVAAFAVSIFTLVINVAGYLTDDLASSFLNYFLGAVIVFLFIVSVLLFIPRYIDYTEEKKKKQKAQTQTTGATSVSASGATSSTASAVTSGTASTLTGGASVTTIGQGEEEGGGEEEDEDGTDED